MSTPSHLGTLAVMTRSKSRTVEDDVGENGLQPQGDPPTGEVLADRVVLTGDGDRTGGVGGALDLYWGTSGELGPGGRP